MLSEEVLGDERLPQHQKARLSGVITDSLSLGHGHGVRPVVLYHQCGMVQVKLYGEAAATPSFAVAVF